MPVFSAPTRLRTNGLERPLGVDDQTLRLTWEAGNPFDTEATTVVQLLAGAASYGHVEAFQEHTLPSHARHILIRAPSAQMFGWRVGVRVGQETLWSDTAEVIQAIDFVKAGASWIGHPSTWALKSRSLWYASHLTVDGTHAERAFLHLAAPGVVDVRIDGDPVDCLLAPGYAHPYDEIPAVTIDLGELPPGEHLVSIELASGPFRVAPTPKRYAKLTLHSHAPILLAAVQVVRYDGRVETSASGPGFQTGIGPTTSTNWYGGEDYDAGAPEPWESSGVTARSLAPAAEFAIWWPQHPPITVAKRLGTSAIVDAADGGTIFDFGQNIAALPRLEWCASNEPRLIQVWPAEHARGGEIDQESTGSPIYDTVTTRSGESGAWRPRFAYHGFRYLHVSGAPRGEVSASAEVVRASNQQVGTFSCDDPFLMWMNSAVTLAIQGNMFSVFTDCPHREKLGWLEQLQLCFGALTRTYDLEAHLRSTMHHVRMSQLPSGAIPNIAPELTDFSGHSYLGDDDAFRFDINWGGVIALLPAAHYREYGDVRILEENREPLRRFLVHMASREKDGLLDFGLGDWIALDNSTPRALVATYGYWRVLRAAEEIGRRLRDSPLLTLAREGVERIKSTLSLWAVPADASQGELALAAFFAQSERLTTANELASRLIDRIHRDDDAFTVGEVAFEPLVAVLHRHGADNLVNRVIRRSDVPGYGMQYVKGVTALAETWSAEGGQVGEGSNNHFMLGMIHHWLTDNVAGLSQHPDSVGWARALIQPTFLDGVTKVSTTHQSVSGIYAVNWTRLRSGEISLSATVPSHGHATLRLPTMPDRELEPGSHTIQLPSAAALTKEPS